MIKAVIFDIDGILTDGSVSIDANGVERKSFNLREADALNEYKNNDLMIAAITAEQNEMTAFFNRRFPWDKFFSGYKNKMAAIKSIEQELGVGREEICYLGDGKYDIEAIEYSGLGVCPKDACIGAREVADIILETEGGKGCIEDLLGRIIRQNKCLRSNYALRRFLDHQSIIHTICSDYELQEKILNVADIMLTTVNNGNAIFFCGNGGSAADAQHIATEFVSRFYKEREAINAEALTVNTSSLTAIANDYSFDKVYSRQLEAKGKPGDVLVGISTSGNSENIWNAFRYAKTIGIITILLTGKEERINNNSMQVDHIIAVPSEVTPRIQEVHILIGHIWAEYVEENEYR